MKNSRRKVLTTVLSLSLINNLLMIALPVSAESMSTIPTPSPTEETIVTTSVPEEETVMTTPTLEEETIATTLDPEQESTAFTFATTTTVTTTTMVTEETTEDENHEFIVGIWDEFALFEMLNLDTTVRFVQVDEDEEKIAEIASWNSAEENPYRISQELLDEDAVYSVVIDEIPEGYSYTYQNKSNVKYGEFRFSDLETGDYTVKIYIRDEPAREQIQYPVSGIIPVDFHIKEKYTYEVIENVDATVALLNEDGSVKEILGKWNTSETPVFSFDMPYVLENEQSRIAFGVYVENLPEEYINLYPDNYIVDYFSAFHLESMRKSGKDTFEPAVYFEKKDAEYTYTSTDVSESKETTTTTTTTVTNQVGDVNGDGRINILDVIALNKAVLGKQLLTDVQNQAADVNGDGSIDATDSLTILKYIVGLIDSFDTQQT